MGKLGPVFLALMLNLNQTYIFRTPQYFDCFPYISHVIFLFSLFALLWDACFYATGFRKLYFWVDFTLEFLTAMCIMEIVMNDFWLPLQKSYIAAIPSLAAFIMAEAELSHLNFDIINRFCNTLKSQEGLYIASCALSAFFFLAIAHATRLTDLRILKNDGVIPFIDNSMCRTKMFIKTMVKSMKSNKKCRQAKSSCSTNKCSRPEPSKCNNDPGYDSDDFCSCDCGNRLYNY